VAVEKPRGVCMHISTGMQLDGMQMPSPCLSAAVRAGQGRNRIVGAWAPLKPQANWISNYAPRPAGFFVHPPENGRPCPVEENMLVSKWTGGNTSAAQGHTGVADW
jgi:hypothetical protein